MKKITIAFTAGQALQLVILFAGQTLTYASNLFLFCVILGAAATLMLLLVSVQQRQGGAHPDRRSDGREAVRTEGEDMTGHIILVFAFVLVLWLIGGRP